MNIKQNIFSGIRPSTAIHLLGPGEAQTAQNCKLDKGDLRPWKQYKYLKTVSGLGTPKTLFLYKNGDDDNWIVSNDEYDFARSPVKRDVQERLYYTGANEPRVIAKDIVSDPFDFSTDYYKLGIPAPAALLIDLGYTTGNIYRAYAYSYVVRINNRDYEEGPPSSITAISDYGSGAVTLSGFTEPPDERQIGTIRVYRTNAATAGFASFQFVGEFQTDGFDFDDGIFLDNVAEADLGTDSPQPESYVGPPEELTGLIALLNGSFAGFVGNVVYVSEPNLPHAWPYEYPVDSTIIGLGWFGTTGVVLTDSHVYLLIGAPEAMDVMKLDGVYPCLSKRGIVTDVGKEGGVLFPSEEGWALVSINGVDIISKPFMDPTTWRDNYNPASTHAYFYEEKLFGFHAGGSYVVDFKNDRFTTLNIYPDACHRSRRSGSFYFIKGNEDADQPGQDHAIYQWEADNYDFLQYTWKSKKFILPFTTNMAAARVLRSAAEISTLTSSLADAVTDAAANAAALLDDDVGGFIDDDLVDAAEVHGDDLVTVQDISATTDITFKLYGDGTLLFTKTVQDNNPFRLPADLLYKHLEYELIGYVPIKEVTVAPSMDEIEEVPNA